MNEPEDMFLGQTDQPRSVYIAFEAFPRPKGASSHIASMVEAMADSHGPVLLLCLGYGNMPAFQQEGDITIRRFKEYHPNMLYRAGAFGEFIEHAIDRYAASAELCVFRDPWGGNGVIHSSFSGALAFEVNALPSWELGYTYSQFRKQVTLQTKIRGLERSCLREVDQILTISSVTAEALHHTLSNVPSITVIPNSAHPAFFECQNEKHPDPVIGYFGSLHGWQGVEVALEAFSMIAGEFPTATMDVITGGHKLQRKALRRLSRKLGLEERVNWLPSMQAPELADHVSRWEFSLAPLHDTPRNTVQGCCPIKIIESMAAGTAVLASNLRVNREILGDSDAGLLIPPGNVRKWAVAMKECLEQPRLCRERGETARRYATSRFSRPPIHRELSEFFNTTCLTHKQLEKHL